MRGRPSRSEAVVCADGRRKVRGEGVRGLDGLVSSARGMARVWPRLLRLPIIWSRCARRAVQPRAQQGGWGTQGMKEVPGSSASAAHPHSRRGQAKVVLVVDFHKPHSDAAPSVVLSACVVVLALNRPSDTFTPIHSEDNARKRNTIR